MKRKKYTEQQIINILKEAEAGLAVTELSRRDGFSCQHPIFSTT